jgi:hypothetical protein
MQAYSPSCTVGLIVLETATDGAGSTAFVADAPDGTLAEFLAHLATAAATTGPTAATAAGPNCSRELVLPRFAPGGRRLARTSRPRASRLHADLGGLSRQLEQVLKQTRRRIACAARLTV